MLKKSRVQDDIINILKGLEGHLVVSEVEVILGPYIQDSSLNHCKVHLKLFSVELNQYFSTVIFPYYVDTTGENIKYQIPIAGFLHEFNAKNVFRFLWSELVATIKERGIRI